MHFRLFEPWVSILVLLQEKVLYKKITECSYQAVCYSDATKQKEKLETASEFPDKGEIVAYQHVQNFPYTGKKATSKDPPSRL